MRPASIWPTSPRHNVIHYWMLESGVDSGVPNAGTHHCVCTRNILGLRWGRWQAAADREWRAKERAARARTAGIHADLAAARDAQAAEKAVAVRAAAAAGAVEAAVAAAAAAAARAERAEQVEH